MIALVATVLGATPYSQAKEAPRFTLWQLPSQGPTQMMSYVIKSAGGKVLVVDGGMTCDGAYLREFLEERGGHVDGWFITHPHQDHLNALTWILSNPGDLEIGKIYASFPSLEWLRKYEGGTAKTLECFLTALEHTDRNHTELNRGDIFDFDEIHIEVLSVSNTHITFNAVNNSSVVMRFSDPTKSILFTGDIGVEAGDNILETVEHQKLKAVYVQMAHHGQGCAGKNFYEVVDPVYCLWPTPLWLWDNNNGGGKGSGPWGTLETRKWMEELNVKSNYVSGVSGLVEIQ